MSAIRSDETILRTQNGSKKMGLRNLVRWSSQPARERCIHADARRAMTANNLSAMDLKLNFN